MDVSHLLDGLNDDQRQAVASPLGAALVLAGAGSGKTRGLVHGVAWVIPVGGAAPPSSDQNLPGLRGSVSARRGRGFCRTVAARLRIMAGQSVSSAALPHALSPRAGG